MGAPLEEMFLTQEQCWQPCIVKQKVVSASGFVAYLSCRIYCLSNSGNIWVVEGGQAVVLCLPDGIDTVSIVTLEIHG